MKYQIGTQYLSSGKHPHVCLISDYWTTTNIAGQIVKERYVASHMFMGQYIIDYDVNEVTIARGLDRLEDYSKRIK